MTRTARYAAPAAAVALALGAAGCGIRGTSVPVDAGAAPSRVSCEEPTDAGVPAAREGIEVKVFLVCGSQLVPVRRTDTLPKGSAGTGRLRIARALLSELHEQPSPAEDEAGFDTAVPKDLDVSGPRAGDPPKSWRLSLRPDDLPAFALAQVVCTFGDSVAADGDRSASLGGPDDAEPRRFDCTRDVLTHPVLARDTFWSDAPSAAAR